jgi:hypothetical protein
LVLYKPKGSKAEVNRVVLVLLGLVGLRLALEALWVLVVREALRPLVLQE